LTPLASILKVLLESVGRPLTEDFSTVKGDGFRLNEAITEAAIADLASASLFFFLFFPQSLVFSS
jgi:DNA-binding winged helix-turn-helix (wHTH) protein